MEGQTGWSEHAVFMDRLVDEGFIVLGGPIENGPRVLLVIEASTVEQVRSTLAGDPWNETHLLLDSIERWTIRLDRRLP
jgi:hypothetical protein